MKPKPVTGKVRVDISTKHTIFRGSEKTTAYVGRGGQGGQDAVNNNPYILSRSTHLMGGFHGVIWGSRLPKGLGASASRQHVKEEI